MADRDADIRPALWKITLRFAVAGPPVGGLAFLLAVETLLIIKSFYGAGGGAGVSFFVGLNVIIGLSYLFGLIPAILAGFIISILDRIIVRSYLFLVCVAAVGAFSFVCLTWCWFVFSLMVEGKPLSCVQLTSGVGPLLVYFGFPGFVAAMVCAYPEIKRRFQNLKVQGGSVNP